MAQSGILAEQFDDLDQQKETSVTGMWTFLATEILFFGGLFVAYTVYRTTYPNAFALGSHHASLLLGSLNTAILLTSSLTMALSVQAARDDHRKLLVAFLGLTLFFGLTFLALKGVEYSQHISEGFLPGARFRAGMPRGTELFFLLYFIMTGLHALHMLAGCCVLIWIIRMGVRSKFSSRYYTPVEVTALYWHFVDVIWLFLYPLFYLIHS